jgi:signal transduction histidine kinase
MKGTSSPDANGLDARATHAQTPARQASFSQWSREVTSPTDPRFLALMIHDLRNPLNVIGLSLRMIEEVVPRDDPDLLEDVEILRENVAQIERMLTALADYSRQLEGRSAGDPIPFDAPRLVTDVVDELKSRCGSKAHSLSLEVGADCPAEVELDPHRVRLAIWYATNNALAAAAGAPVRVTARGRPNRWIIEILADTPPGEAVRAVTLRPDRVERLVGTAAERQGLELAIVAGICEQFGGTARLDVDALSSRLILDWPTSSLR